MDFQNTYMEMKVHAKIDRIFLKVWYHKKIASDFLESASKRQKIVKSQDVFMVHLQSQNIDINSPVASFSLLAASCCILDRSIRQYALDENNLSYSGLWYRWKRILLPFLKLYSNNEG